MYFKNSLPIFKLLERFRIFFLSPMPRYIYVSCCTREDHAPNRVLEGFEADIRAGLALCRGHYKDFFYTSGFRNVTVLNPGSSCLRRMLKVSSCGAPIQCIP